MNYFEKLIQDYEQYNVRKNICVSKEVKKQLQLDEPYIVIWEDNYQNIMITSNDEYEKSKNDCLKVIGTITDNNKLNDLINALTYNLENYEMLLNKMDSIINETKKLILK